MGPGRDLRICQFTGLARSGSHHWVTPLGPCSMCVRHSRLVLHHGASEFGQHLAGCIVAPDGQRQRGWRTRCARRGWVPRRVAKLSANLRSRRYSRNNAPHLGLHCSETGISRHCCTGFTKHTQVAYRVPRLPHAMMWGLLCSPGNQDALQYIMMLFHASLQAPHDRFSWPHMSQRFLMQASHPSLVEPSPLSSVLPVVDMQVVCEWTHQRHGNTPRQYSQCCMDNAAAAWLRH